MSLIYGTLVDQFKLGLGWYQARIPFFAYFFPTATPGLYHELCLRPPNYTQQHAHASK